MKKIKKFLITTVGIISFFIGSIGVILPIIPTTPFLLLSSYCFVKSSDKFNLWFKSTKIYKNNLESFIEHNQMTLKQKINILIFAEVMLMVPVILVDNLHMRIFLIIIMIFKIYYFIFKIKTVASNEGDVNKIL